MEPPCPFRILLLPLDASSSDVCSAWRRLSLICHPDKRPGDPTAKARFEALTCARDALLDPSQRASAAEAYVERNSTTGTASSATGFQRVPPSTASRFKRNAPAQASSHGRSEHPQAEQQSTSKRKAQSTAEEGLRSRRTEAEAREQHADRVFFRHLEQRHQRREVWKPATTAGQAAPAVSVGLQSRLRSFPDGQGPRRRMKRSGDKIGINKLGLCQQHGPRHNIDKCENDVPDDDVPGDSTTTSKACTPCNFSQEMQPPLRLPDRLCAKSLAAAIGASLPEAELLTRAVMKLRRFGGEAPLSALGNATRKLQKGLTRHPRVFDVYLPGQQLSSGKSLELMVRLRCLPPTVVQPARCSQSMDFVSNDERGGKRSISLQRRSRGMSWPQEGHCDSQLSPAKCMISSDVESATRSSSSIGSGSEDESQQSQGGTKLEDAFAHCRGAWHVEKAGSPQDNGPPARHCLFLLPAGDLGSLRPGHGPLLFSFDMCSKVLYEYVPASGTCKVLWSPTAPTENAAIWTVLPLPPQAEATSVSEGR